MAEVRKHGQGRGGHIAAAIERAMTQGVRPSGAGAPPQGGGQPPAPRNTQHLVTATSFLSSDPFLPTPRPADDADQAATEPDPEAGGGQAGTADDAAPEG